jgi:hypothetical protein
MILSLSTLFLTIPQIKHDDHLNMDPGGSYPGLVARSCLEETRNSFFWKERGLLKPVAPYFVHDYFQLSEKGGEEQSVSP